MVTRMNEDPTNHAHFDEIIKYAVSRGVENAKVECRGAGGYFLVGDGKDEDNWPLVWSVAQECGISWGCGAGNWHQIKPELFNIPGAEDARAI